MEAPHIVLKAEELFKIGPVPITNSFFMMVVIMALLLIVFTIAARRITTDPQSGGRFGSAIEFIVEFLLNLVETIGGKKLGRSILPLVSGLFIFIIFANFSGLLPGVGSVYVEKDAPANEAAQAIAYASTTVTDQHAMKMAADHEGKIQVPIMRPPTADLNMTLAMSTITFIAVQIFGVRAHGAGGRIKHMANPPFIFPIEVVSELSRIISLAARLFGNVFAGEVLLGVAYSISSAIKISVVGLFFPVMFLGLEVLFGTIQALVFALLTLIYIFLAAAGHGDEEEHAEPAQAGTEPVGAGD